MDRDHQLNLAESENQNRYPKDLNAFTITREEKTPLLIYNEDRMGNPCLNLINN